MKKRPYKEWLGFTLAVCGIHIWMDLHFEAWLTGAFWGDVISSQVMMVVGFLLMGFGSNG